MDKKISLLILLALIFLPLTAFAVDVAVTDINTLMAAIVGNLIWVGFAAFAVIMFLYAGIMFLSAEGDASKLKKAKSSVLWGFVGVIAGVLAFSALSFFIRIL